MIEAFGLDTRVDNYKGIRPISFYSWDLDCNLGVLDMVLNDENEYPDQEACEYVGAEWDDYEWECYIEDEETCNELGGDWVDDPCMGFIFESNQSDVFGCTDEGDIDNYNPDAVIDDGSCVNETYNTTLPDRKSVV